MNTFWYDHQIKRYFIQFCAIFGAIQVQVGWNEDKEPRLIKVPIFAGSKDRVVAAIKSENTQNKPFRVPAMSAVVTGYNLAPERRKGVTTERRHVFMPTGGLFPDDARVIEQRMPVPYNVDMELSIWASNQDQHYQILEQILMLFNPILQIQTSDDAFDWNQITTVELMGITPEENVPAGADHRLITTTLQFQIPVHITVPANIHDKYVRDIYIRIGMVSNAATSYDILEELDAQGLPYELNFSVNDIEGIDQT